MRKFHLQARRLVGPLSAPVCDDRTLADSDSRVTLLTQAEELAAQGYTVWIFRRMPGGPTALRPISRLVERIDPSAPADRGREALGSRSTSRQTNHRP